MSFPTHSVSTVFPTTSPLCTINLTTSASTEAQTNGMSYRASNQWCWMAATGQGPQQNIPEDQCVYREISVSIFHCKSMQSIKSIILTAIWSRGLHVPSLFSCGVGSTTCQPSHPAPRSGLLIQHSTHTWKFLQEVKYTVPKNSNLKVSYCIVLYCLSRISLSLHK